jgi:hypothetical protein
MQAERCGAPPGGYERPRRVCCGTGHSLEDGVGLGTRQLAPSSAIRALPGDPRGWGGGLQKWAWKASGSGNQAASPSLHPSLCACRRSRVQCGVPPSSSAAVHHPTLGLPAHISGWRVCIAKPKVPAPESPDPVTLPEGGDLGTGTRLVPILSACSSSWAFRTTGVEGIVQAPPRCCLFHFSGESYAEQYLTRPQELKHTEVATILTQQVRKLRLNEATSFAGPYIARKLRSGLELGPACL